MSTMLEADAAVASARERVLTPEAIEFVQALEGRFRDERARLLQRRAERNARIASGAETPSLLTGTKHVRESEWQVAPAPPDLQRRHAEITGPVDRKMMIHALNSGADCFMADFEDSLAPTWSNVILGQANLMDAARRTIRVAKPDGGEHSLNQRTATLLVRPRGWHLDETHFLLHDRPVSASLFDFGLHFFHNAHELIERGSGPYFYLPKMESHLEARLWNDVFVFAQDALGVPRGTIRATVLIETVLAAFEMQEILYELREHMSGLNAGRWDYIFSAIKRFAPRDDAPLFPDRSQVTMTVPFMRAYTDLLVAACHRRGAHAMGGMSAFIPNRREPEVTERAVAKVREDKERESRAGFDGTWVAHPDLVPLAQEVFAANLDGADHQKHVRHDELLASTERSGGAELLAFRIDGGSISRDGVRTNIRVALQYLSAWLGGQGAVAIDNLMEDAATAEISRAQLWQWVHRGARLDSGETVDAALYRSLRQEVVAELSDGADAEAVARLDQAARLVDGLVLDEGCAEFLTTAGVPPLRNAK